MVIIEQKASGTPLTHELRQMDIPVMTFTPSRGNDKHVRVNSCAPLFEAGIIWAPDRKFAEEVVEECASFPYGDHDDFSRFYDYGCYAIQAGRLPTPSRRL
jgi:predicted phage terminase large subunit-like protein